MHAQLCVMKEYIADVIVLGEEGTLLVEPRVAFCGSHRLGRTNGHFYSRAFILVQEHFLHILERNLELRI